MARSPSPATSSVPSDDETDKSFSDTEPFVHRPEDKDGGQESESGNGWELDYIEDARITINDETDRVERAYKLKFKGYEESEWQPENNVDALELVRCYWEHIERGPGDCIRAQQQLLLEIEERPDSEEDESGHPSNPNPAAPNPNGHHKYSRQNKKFTHHKQLKPRREANSDVADTESDSGDEGSDEEPLTYSLPPALCRADHQADDSNQPGIHPVECTYKPRTLKMRKQMKNELGGSRTNLPLDPVSSLSSLLGRIDLDLICRYKAKNPEIAKRMEKLIEEVKFDSLKLTEIRTRKEAMKKNKPRPRLRVIEPGKKQKATRARVEADIPVPALRQGGDDENERGASSTGTQERLQANKSERNEGKGVRKENRTDDVPCSITSKFPEEHCTRSPPKSSPKKARPSNPHHLRLASPTKGSSSSKVMSVGSSSSSPQPTATSSNQQLSEDEALETFHHVHNPRIKRKFTDTNNMKYHTYNQIKKKCRKSCVNHH